MRLHLWHFRFLEDELARRYRDAAPATLALLQGRCESVTAELLAIDSQLKSVRDVSSLRRAGDALSFICLPLHLLPLATSVRHGHSESQDPAEHA